MINYPRYVSSMFWFIVQYLILVGLFTYCFVYAIRDTFIPCQMEEFAELYLGIDSHSDDEETDDEETDDEETDDEEEQDKEQKREYDELDASEKTKEGYLRDDFVVDDEETDDEETDDEETDDDETDDDFQMPTVGSHITFTMIDNDIRPPRAVKRAISTYGYNPVDPEEGVTYIVVNIIKGGYIPNGKGATAKTCVDTAIYVYPLEYFDDSNTEVFWYINYDDKTICQYEDGFPLFNLTSMSNIGHKTDDDYLFSPSPV